MSEHAADFRVEIIKGRPQSVRGIQFQIVGSLEVEFSLAPDPAGDVIDITDRIPRDGLGTINRAMERDLLSFKTGDVTLTARNQDGFFDDLFAFFGTTTIWQLRVFRRGELKFSGAVIGLGSISFDRKTKTCEITAYGLTKLLDRTDAFLARRPFAVMTVTTATGGTASLTLNSTFNLLTGDVLHITDHVNSEDVTVKQVTSGTVVQLDANLSNSYASGSPVTIKTPFHRYKSIAFLVERLFKAAFVGMADLRLSNSQFKNLAPTPVNLEGLSLANNARRGMGQYTGRWDVGIHGVDDYSQGDPDEAWTVQGLPDRGLYDHSPYFVEKYDHKAAGSAYAGEPQPGIFEPVAGATQEGNVTRFATYWGAVDYLSSPTKRIWGTDFHAGTGNATHLRERTTTDGSTYTAATSVAVLPNDVTPSIPLSALETGIEYDPVRDFVFVSWRRVNYDRELRYWDLGGAAWVDCKQADDDANTGYYGPRYIADKDYVLVLRQQGGSTGPTFEVCAFRGATRLWRRPFPGCRINQDVAANPAFYPTRTARFVNGSIYLTLVSDGAVQLLRTDDEFVTYAMREIAPSTSNSVIMACRMGSTYRIASYRGTTPRGYYICAPFYAGVIEYADFEGLSGGEALKKLAVLANAVFWVDDDLQGHFVARDLFDTGSVLDIRSRIKETLETLVWDQTAQYVTVSGNSIEATSGDAAFAAEGVDLESSFIPNEAFAQALADSYYEFYSALRKYKETVLHDMDGRIFRPLDRVTPDGASRFLVYESDHSLADDEIAVSLLEDR